ncbi:MAG: LamG domain-containing protein [bacterium]|nr:LamG domain-containing protein [bacterium]
MTPSEKKRPNIITLTGIYFSCGRELPLSFRGSNPFTIEGWVRFTSPRPGSAAIFVKPDEIVLGITADGHAFVRHHPRHYTVVSTSALVADTWHHLGITFDGGDMILYLNGRCEAPSSELTGGVTADVLFDSQPPELDCQVRNFRFWNIVRTPAETLRATWAPVVPQPGLIADFFPELPQLPVDWLVRSEDASLVPCAA